VKQARSRNDFSGEALAVVQAGTVHGGVHHHPASYGRNTLLALALATTIVMATASSRPASPSSPRLPAPPSTDLVAPELQLHTNLNTDCATPLADDDVTASTPVAFSGPVTLEVLAQNPSDVELVILELRVEVHHRRQLRTEPDWGQWGSLYGDCTSWSGVPVHRSKPELDRWSPDSLPSTPPDTASDKDPLFRKRIGSSTYQVKRGDPEMFHIRLETNNYDYNLSVTVVWVADGTPRETIVPPGRLRITPAGCQNPAPQC
jgi:hypothetical protein